MYGQQPMSLAKALKRLISQLEVYWLMSYVSQNIVDAQDRQNKIYDHRHQSSKKIETGSTVFTKNSNRIQRMGSLRLNLDG